MKISRVPIVATFAIVALALTSCERADETGELDEEPFAEDTIGWDLEDDADTTDFEAEAREAGEAIEEGVREGVEAVGAGTERLGEEIQESVEEDEDERP